MLRSEVGPWGGWLPPLLLVVLVVGFYSATTSNPLVSDDYLLVKTVSEGPLAAIRYQGGYHYIPAGMSLLWLESSLWGTDPAGYHWVGILLLAVTGLLVVARGRRLGLGNPASWAAAALLTSNGVIHEIPLWACAVLHSASTCLYLCALLAFLAYLRNGRWRYAVGSTLLYVLALLTHEQSLSLPIAAVLLSAAERQPSSGELWPARWRRAKAPLVAMFVAGAGYVMVKPALSDGTDLTPGLGGGLVSRAGASALHLLRVLLPNLSWEAAWQVLDPPLDGWPKHLVRVAVVAAGAAIFASLPRLGKLLALWAAAHVGMMVFAIGMASRHYLLPLVPASLLVGLVLERIADRLVPASVGRQPGWKRALLVAAGVAPLIAIGVATASSRKAVWAEAGHVAERLLADAARATAARPGKPALFVIDLPDGLDLGESEPAYIFRFGFDVALSWRLSGEPLSIVHLHSEKPPSRTEPFGKATTESELASLTADPQRLVLRYEPEQRRLIELRP